MKINFNLMKCGLGDNGGSQTIIKTANKLSEFGHDVKIVDTIENKHTWNKLKVPHLKINCGASDLSLTLGDIASIQHIDINCGASDVQIKIPKSSGC